MCNWLVAECTLPHQTGNRGDNCEIIDMSIQVWTYWHDRKIVQDL